MNPGPSPIPPPTSPPVSDRPLSISVYSPPDSARGKPRRHETTARELVEALTADPVETAAKCDAPAWSPIVYRGDARRAGEAVGVCALVYDLDSDELPPEQIEALETRLLAAGFLFAIHETWTPGRYRLALPLSRDLAPGEYALAWVAAARRLELPALDQSTGDLARLFYSPSCPPGQGPERYAARGGSHLANPSDFLGLHAPTYPTFPDSSNSQGLANSSNSQGLANSANVAKGENPAGNYSPKIFALDELRRWLKASPSKQSAKDVLDALDGSLVLRRGERDRKILGMTGVLAYLPSKVRPSDEEMLAILEPSLLRMEGVEDEGLDAWKATTLDKYHRALQKRELRDEQNVAVAAFLDGSAPRPEEYQDGQWRAAILWHPQKEGTARRMKSNEANLETVLKHHPEFRGFIRFNLLKRTIEVTGGALHNVPAESLDVALAAWFSRSEFQTDMDRGKCAAVLLYVALQNAYDPVRAYLDALPAWDGTPRMDKLLLNHANAVGNKDYIATVTRKFFISAVARAMKPGCQVDTVLVLAGAQGGGKTSFVRVMGAGYHVETKLDLHNKDAVMVATGNWLVELSELASLRRSDVESVRAFITNREDQIRLPYGRTVESFPRRCVFIGTTNATQPLSDQEGNRRFWVVAVGYVDVPALHAIRDQVWAEAVAAYRAGEEWWLSADEANTAAAEAALFTVEDAVEAAILGWLAETKKPPKFVSSTFVCTRILQKPVGSVSSHDLQAASRALTKLGWEKGRRRIAGVPSTVYRVPAYEEGGDSLV